LYADKIASLDVGCFSYMQLFMVDPFCLESFTFGYLGDLNGIQGGNPFDQTYADIEYVPTGKIAVFQA
jgi:hypothetical protein